MRVALVCDWFLPRLGGIELHLRDLAQRLTARGDEVRIVTPTPGPDSVDGVEVERVRAPRLAGAQTLFTPGGVRAVRDAVAAFEPDVVHAHVSIVSPAAFAGAAAGVALGKPTVLTFHSVIRGLAPVFSGLDVMLSASRWPAVYSAVSSVVAAPVQRLARGEVHLLPNGIEAARWRVAPVLRTDERFEMLAVGRLAPKKRPRVLVDTLARVRRTLGSSRAVRLRIVGEGPERASIERAIRREGLSDAVELLGWRSRDEVRELLGASDVVLMPARYESFGIAALEARCAGVPVVALASSGVRDVIAHGTEGLLARDDAEMASHVVRLATDAALVQAIREHDATTPVAADWSNVLQRHHELYDRARVLVSG